MADDSTTAATGLGLGSQLQSQRRETRTSFVNMIHRMKQQLLELKPALVGACFVVLFNNTHCLSETAPLTSSSAFIMREILFH